MLVELVPTRNISASQEYGSKVSAEKIPISIKSGKNNLSKEMNQKRTFIKFRPNVFRDSFSFTMLVFMVEYLHHRFCIFSSFSSIILRRGDSGVTSFWTCPDYPWPTVLLFCKHWCIDSDNNRTSIWSIFWCMPRLGKTWALVKDIIGWNLSSTIYLTFFTTN